MPKNLEMKTPCLRCRIVRNEAANRHVVIEFPGLSLLDRLRLEWFLRIGEGFHRTGKAIMTMDETVHKDLACDEFRLLTGMDFWSGFYVMAEDLAGDRYLEGLYGRLMGVKSKQA